MYLSHTCHLPGKIKSPNWSLIYLTVFLTDGKQSKQDSSFQLVCIYLLGRYMSISQCKFQWGDRFWSIKATLLLYGFQLCNPNLWTIQKRGEIGWTEEKNVFQEGVSVPLGNKKNGHGWVTPLDIIPSPSTRTPHLLHGTDRSILCVFVVLPTVPSFFFS